MGETKKILKNDFIKYVITLIIGGLFTYVITQIGILKSAKEDRIADKVEERMTKKYQEIQGMCVDNSKLINKVQDDLREVEKQKALKGLEFSIYIKQIEKNEKRIDQHEDQIGANTGEISINKRDIITLSHTKKDK